MTLSKTTRHCAVAALAITLPIGLTGCIPESEIQASLIDGELWFAVCEPLEAQSIHVDGVVGNADQGEVLWELTGEASWGAAQLFEYGEVPSGWVVGVEAQEPNLSADELYLALNSPEQIGDQGQEVRVGSFNPGLLREGNWLSATGALSAEPCS